MQLDLENVKLKNRIAMGKPEVKTASQSFLVTGVEVSIVKAISH